MDEEKGELKDSSNILENIVNESKAKNAKLLSQSKIKISKLNNEKEQLKDEIINLKYENLFLKLNNKEKGNISNKEK